MTLRKKSKSLKFKLILITSLFITSVVFFSLAKQVVHNFQGKCTMCHLVDNEERVFENIFIKEIDFLCKDCHNNLGLSHPTGMKPTMAMPESFDLNSQGKLTCATCHKTHGDGAYLLNSKQSGGFFCYLCHREGLDSLHRSSGVYAHTTGGYKIEDKNSLIDKLSLQCVSCHDSTIGNDTDIGLGTYQREHGASHPIGISYMEAYSKGGLTNPSHLNNNLRLFNGDVGCGTCHNNYSKEPFLLAINNKGSALCLACHRK